MEQLTVRGIDIPPNPHVPPRHRLLFVVLPPNELAAQLVSFSYALRRSHKLWGNPLPQNRLHISLLNLGEFTNFPCNLARQVQEQVSRLTMRSFTAHFDRISAFQVQHCRYAIVLRSSNRHPQGFSHLHRVLAKTFGGNARSSITPHITLLYDRNSIREYDVSATEWHVGDVALVHSKINRGSLQPYSILNRWRLNAAS